MRCETGCRRHVQTLWENEDRGHEIELCGIDSDRLAPALVADGYQQIYDDRETARHPRLPKLTADPATH